MVVALVALIFGAMVLVGDGPEVAMGSDQPELTTQELSALDAESVQDTATKAEDNPAVLTTAPPAIEETPAPVLEASLGAATDAAVEAALAELPADEPTLEEEPASVELTTVGVVIGQRVNVRSGPSTGNGVIGQVVQDQEVEILSYEDNGWARILLNGEEGYMSGDFLRELPQG
ncbi:SH3 domain-containing protein [Oceanicola sp. D3]|uniref:SH3 domain-containing protein n=1 Tax=Oceanicola sp. D3 TaxID=2587163 RepID=UPI0020C7CF84|nr:SH3 domain-containing protein [Oceanicola sp. D3]